MLSFELWNGVFYPKEWWNPTTELAKSYRTLVEYQKQSNSYTSNSNMTFIEPHSVTSKNENLQELLLFICLVINSLVMMSWCLQKRNEKK